MRLREWILSKIHGSVCSESEKTPVLTTRRVATIRGRATAVKSDEEELDRYLKNYKDDVTYGADGGELTGQTIKGLAMALFKAGDDSKTIISGLPKYSATEEKEYAECMIKPDEGEYEKVEVAGLSAEDKEIAALGIIGGINKLLNSGIDDDAIHRSILEELKPLGYNYSEITQLATKIDSRHDNLINKLTLFNGGKRARRVRRTKRTKGKSRGRAGKATRVRRNNNNSNNNAKTKRNKGKKRRTKRA